MATQHKDDGLRAQIETQIDEYKENVSKFFDLGNNAAGTRARKALTEITKISKELRKKIQDAKNESK
ncbi:MAG: histone H1 [Dehalococcoidia bacterium]|mgnify:FL=1|tara:strand:+ start:17910 stop:18110 length:201 start_codon:yes stop_codon:yes gene_type:complete